MCCAVLCCAHGYISHLSSALLLSQVEYATFWWTAVFPAFPRWVEELQAAGLTRDSADGRRLLASVTTPSPSPSPANNNNNNKNKNKNKNKHSNSNSNNLIFKYPKDVYGEVPHFKGKAQNAALELSPMVAVEVYACVTCLYSMATLC